MPDSVPDPIPDSVPDSVPDPIPDPTTDIRVVNNEAGGRYEAWIGEALAGFTQYALDDGIITFIHTQVADAFEGKGVASVLVRSALDDVRAVGTGTATATATVRALCPFVRAFIERHEEYQELLSAETD